ncbi:MAG: hypothetical protein U0V73_06800 [Acidimicrobiia bacterium]
MDIEEFYDADPRRRASEELEFGRDWHDEAGARFELSWVVDTGELYLMREPVEPLELDPLGDVGIIPMPTKAVTVEVLGTVADRDALGRVLDGWADAMPGANSVAWVRARVAAG